MTDPFHSRIIKVLKSVPKGKVTTYGQVAALAGNPGAARQVVRALHSSTRSADLPWHRVINAKGRISLPPGAGFEMQQAMLRDEGIDVTDGGAVDLKRFGWRPKGVGT
jgi:methylated-DNA-protein-cysteine methyltransferase-like protein